MNFRDLIDTASSLALSDHLSPTEISVWERYCRDFSSKFATPLLEVRAMDPLFVLQQVSADNLSEFNAEENMENLFEMLGSLADPDYDIKKERAIREEMAQIEEREAERIREGRAVHSSMEKDKRVISADQPPKEKPPVQQLPKSGGLNMSAINRLNNQDNEG